jgi:hypothetical protein
MKHRQKTNPGAEVFRVGADS